MRTLPFGNTNVSEVFYAGSIRVPTGYTVKIVKKPVFLFNVERTFTYVADSSDIRYLIDTPISSYMTLWYMNSSDKKLYLRFIEMVWNPIFFIQESKNIFIFHWTIHFHCFLSKFGVRFWITQEIIRFFITFEFMTFGIPITITYINLILRIFFKWNRSRI